MNGMHAVDANILVRILTRDDPQQAIIADAFIEQGAWVSLVAFAEALWVLRAIYQLKPAEIANAVEMLLKHTGLSIQEQDVVAAALRLFRSRPSLGFSDCLILELARKAGHLPLGTFDRNLGKLEGTRKL